MELPGQTDSERGQGLAVCSKWPKPIQVEKSYGAFPEASLSSGQCQESAPPRGRSYHFFVCLFVLLFIFIF